MLDHVLLLLLLLPLPLLLLPLLLTVVTVHHCINDGAGRDGKHLHLGAVGVVHLCVSEGRRGGGGHDGFECEAASCQ
jgi:hypothetical protein